MHKLIKKFIAKCFTIKLLSYCIVIFTIIPLYIILCVKLECAFTPHLGYSVKATQINEVLLNLSYSYIAAVIFYLLLTYIPYKIRARNTKNFIEDNFLLLNKSVDNIILLLNGIDPNAKFLISYEVINKLIDNNYSLNWEEKDKAIIQKAKHEIISGFASEIIKYTNNALEYRDYLKEDQYKILLEIKGDITIQLLTLDFFPRMCNKREDAKNGFKDSLYKLVKRTRSLLKTNIDQNKLLGLE